MFLKDQLAPVASSFARDLSELKGHNNFGLRNVMADTEVFFAYAKFVGPICVASRQSGRTRFYSDSSAPSRVSVYVHLRRSHFTRLNPR